MILGTLAGVYILGFSLITSILLASMFASHTLITYPIVSKLGITKNRAVNISIGSTLITNILALLVLAIIVGMSNGSMGGAFWIKLLLSFTISTLIILLAFPRIARWFFKRYNDSVSQYIFVLVIVFLGAILSQWAGIEAIIGAFMAGLALNRLVTRTSPLMNRINFVGNAIFIPFFLIGVGMLIDYRAFSNPQTLFVAFIMSTIATLAKFLAAWLTQKSFRFSKEERQLMFGLTNSQAAATLAAVLIGYNIILGTNELGEPIRLLNDHILNGTIIMILVTCTIASFATQRGAQSIALSDESHTTPSDNPERILIPISNPNTLDEIINISTILKSKSNTDGLIALSVVPTGHSGSDTGLQAKKLLDKALVAASAVDLKLKTSLRYSDSPVKGITHMLKEKNITDLLLGLHESKGLSDSFLGEVTQNILTNSNITTYIYHTYQPISTIRRHFVLIPENAENESGFSFWLAKIWNIALNTGATIIFYAGPETLKLIKSIHLHHPIQVEFNEFTDWLQLMTWKSKLRKDDNVTVVLSRENLPSYNDSMAHIPNYINKYLIHQNFLLIYPSQLDLNDERVDLTYPSLISAIEKIDGIGKTVAGIFKKKHL
ncbi:Na+/H+ antiporter [Geofilum rubicundum JCM 15548]|uniref:Na+/H+ antiporter n=1 Tax=Geofilum rubicundum JCM 15548 TaxID=1236989 RepID=A0A0E9M2X6_9BACT|nr:cation:proton antiporter [Geofilum rubicundum]GAO31505.1 Na+/H+ antiporter [Geofilum rubicundum JCM 15548]